METFEGSYKRLDGFEVTVAKSDEPEHSFILTVKHKEPELIYVLYEKLIEMIRLE